MSDRLSGEHLSQRDWDEFLHKLQALDDGTIRAYLARIARRMAANAPPKTEKPLTGFDSVVIETRLAHELASEVANQNLEAATMSLLKATPNLSGARASLDQWLQKIDQTVASALEAKKAEAEAKVNEGVGKIVKVIDTVHATGQSLADAADSVLAEGSNGAPNS
jgi:hypothetical protein